MNMIGDMHGVCLTKGGQEFGTHLISNEFSQEICARVFGLLSLQGSKEAIFSYL
jgi:hypothetical protein